MKKSFKRFLSSAVVTVLAVAGATIGMTAVAMAATTMWVYNDDGIDAVPEDWGFNYSSDVSITIDSNRTATFAESIFADGTNSLVNKNGLAFDSNSVSGNRSFSFSPETDGTFDFFVARPGGSTGTFRLYYLDADGVRQQIGSDYAGYGRDDQEIEPISLDVDAGTTYVLYANNGSSALYAVRFTEDDGLSWPTADEQTDAVSAWVGGEVINYSSGNAVYNGAVNNGGSTSSNSRIRLGKDACTDTANPTIANCGYISFPGLDGGFTINISASSSGSGSRTFYVGLVNDDGTFTDKATFTVPDSTATTVSAKIYNSSSDETYAVYVKPYESDGVLVPAENTNINSIDVVPIDAAYLTTPEVTLSNVTIDGDGMLTVTGTFNDFSGTYYLVDSITLRAAVGKTGEEEAVWTLNDITVLRDNGDDTVSFVAKGYDPKVDARLQAVATYDGVADITADVQDVTIYSNVVSYSVE